MSQAVFRFAPSPNGDLHLGHAYSALLNQRFAREQGGKLLLRIEDIDPVRCTPQREKRMLEDLEWLGFEWDEAPLRQSTRIKEYGHILEQLEQDGFVYPTTASRGEIKRQITLTQKAGMDWPHDPDGTPHYPGNERELSRKEHDKLKQNPDGYSLRLNTSKVLSQVSTLLEWEEISFGSSTSVQNVTCQPEDWGDVLLSRKDIPTSYHLACVLDDAAQGITHVVRGKDLYYATSIHRILQEILGLSAPVYHHHELIVDADGNKLSKSRKDTSLRKLREVGYSAEDVSRKVFSNTGNPSAD